MEALAFLVPAVATAALGGALLVPIRDGRAGRKATLDGRSPLLADFRNVRTTDEAPATDDASRAISDVASELAVQTSAGAIPTVVALPDAAAATQPLADAVPSPATSTSPTFDAIAIMRSAAKRLRMRAPEPLPENDVVSERSFADELSSLLPHVPSAVPPLVASAEPITTSEAIAEMREETIVEIAEPHHDVVAAPVAAARVVPLTRLPLRRQSKEVTWPSLASPPLSFASAAERYAFLRAAATESDQADDALLALAFREETSEGRALALGALRRTSASQEAIETFTEALGTGSDDERALAVDALSEAGAREQIARGLTDRIDAIAAKAALAYVGTTARDDYRVALSPLVDESRIETILALLAGVVE
jgi:hypothetical protein